MGYFKNFMKGRQSIVAAAVVGVLMLVAGVLHTSVFAQEVTLGGARDCDSNAVIYCGAMTTGELTRKYNANASARNIFAGFGISSTQVNNMGTQTVAGKVTKDGNVIVNGKVVATGAVTAGRENIAGSTKVTHNGTTFYKRSPSVSFRSTSLDAFVVMVNGKFAFAVIAACGNPVTAKPVEQPKPNYTMQKDVVIRGQSNWSNNVTVKAGDKVTYRVVVRSTGNAPVTNLVVKDTLPKNVTYVPGTLKRDNVVVADGDKFFTSGIPVASLANGKQTIFGFDAVVGANENAETCKAETLTNVAHTTAAALPNLNDTADVSKQCVAKPVYTCESITVTPLNRTQYKVTVNADAKNGAAVTGYKFDFGDTKTATQTGNVVTHTYATPGEYTIKTVALVKVGTQTREAAGPQCVAKVTIAAAPVAECKALTLTKDVESQKKVTATVTYTAPEGMKPKSITYNFGDGSAPVTTDKLTATYEYAKPGNYTVIASMTFTVEGKDVTTACQQTLTIDAPVVPPAPETPVTLPEAGISSFLGLFAGTSVLGGIAHYLFALRRSARQL